MPATDSLHSELESRARAGVVGMSRTLRRRPLEFKSYADEVARGRVKPMGRAVEYAVACIRARAPLAHAVQPFQEAIGLIVSAYCQITRKNVADLLEEASREVGEAQTAHLRLMRRQEDAGLTTMDGAITETEKAIASLEAVAEKLYELRSSR